MTTVCTAIVYDKETNISELTLMNDVKIKAGISVQHHSEESNNSDAAVEALPSIVKRTSEDALDTLEWNGCQMTIQVKEETAGGRAKDVQV